MRRIFIAASLFLASLASFGQSELTLPFMENVYQSTYANPAAMPEHKISIGLPGISSVYGGITNTGFAYNDMVGRRSNDTTYLDFDKMISKMGKKNYFYTGASVDLFSFRIKVRDYFFSINVTEKFSSRFSYPKDLFRLIWDGNAAFIGGEADLRSLGLDMMHYREYGLQVAKQTRFWVFGARVKYLTGLSDVNLKTKDLALGVGKDMYDLTFNSNATLNTAGIPLDSNDATPSPRAYLMNFKNPGFVIDGGVTYKMNNKWRFSFSFNNIGFITWKDVVHNYTVNGGTTFSGFDAGKAYFNNTAGDMGNNTLDSLKKSFKYTETKNKYTTWLIPQFYLTAKYRLGKGTEAAASVFMDRYKAFRPAFSVAITQKAGRVFNVIASYSIRYGKFNNVGLGLMVKPGPFQIYAVTDNIMAIAYPTSVNNFNLRLGMNLVFGRIKDADKQPYTISN